MSITFSLANLSTKISRGLVEELLVQIDNFIIQLIL